MVIKFLKKWLEPKPFYEGYLPVADGHAVYFAEYGNPSGKPVLFFHGGPGGSFKVRHAAFANPKKYRIIGFDQRGCGKSKPKGEIAHNDTMSLLKDVERLLDYLRIDEKVILRGASWGSTLALLFAEAHPEKIEKLLLSQIFLADSTSQNWELSGTRMFYPEFVDKLQATAGAEDVRSYFAGEINSSDARRQTKAANLYGSFERVCGALEPHWGQFDVLDEDELASQRVYINYASRKFMLKDLQILKNIDKIAGIPVIIVHNRLDFVCPVYGAYMLHKLLPNSQLVIVPDRGHVSALLYKTMNKIFAEELKK